MDKRSILAFVLIFVVIILMPVYYKLINPEGETSPGSKPRTSRPPEQTQTAPPTPAQAPKPEPVKQSSPAKHFVKGEQEARLLSIETELFRATLSSRGGGTFTQFTLKEYQSYLNGDTTPVQLLPANGNHPLLLSYISIDRGDTVALDQNFTLLSTSSSHFSTGHLKIRGRDSLQITYGLLQNGQPQVKKTLTFYGNKYQVRVTANLSALLDDMATGNYYLNWQDGLSYSEPDLSEENRYAKAYAYSAAGEMEKIDTKPGKPDQTKFEGNTKWTAIRTKYFATLFITETPAEGYRLQAHTEPYQGEYIKKFDMRVTYPGHRPSHTRLFVGPLDYNRVKVLAEDTENIMSLGGIIRPISKLVLWSFTKLNKVIPNYGLVIIIFAILVKIILSPLTNKSTRSMKEMQKLQPKISELREKYKDEPQKLNQATMKLYKEHGVNPMGGCLPLLLQMPILIAMFTIFRSTIALRHTPFILWITDLSAPDTIYTLPFSIPLYGQYVNVLPFLMVLSQILQQKISGTGNNPQQKSMMYLMPLVFFFIFNKFPSGLNLYYTLFNILTMVQQKYFTPEPKPKKTKRKKWSSRLERMRELQKQRAKEMQRKQFK